MSRIHLTASRKKTPALVAVALFWLFCQSLWASAVPEARVMASEPAILGDYEIYYSAFPGTFISPEVAKQYKLERNPRGGLVNIAVRKVPTDSPGRAVTAKLTGTAANLLGQETSLQFKEIREGDAVYYLAPFRFTHQERLKFTITATPDEAQASKKIEFSQTFYEDGK